MTVLRRASCSSSRLKPITAAMLPAAFGTGATLEITQAPGGGDVMAALKCPACAADVGRSDLICFTCGANLPSSDISDDSPLPVTVMQETIGLDKAARRISATLLQIAFPARNL